MSLLTDLVSYWDLIANSNDSHGSNNGTDTAISYTASSTIGTAAEFNGSTSQINFGNNSSLTLASGGSISLWVETDILTGYRLMLNKGAINSSYMLLQDADFSPVRIAARNGASSLVTVNPSSMAINTGYHVVYTWQGSSAKLYINGTEVASTTTGVVLSNTANLILGFSATGGAAGNRWDGHINRVGIWSKILTSTEASDLYNSGAGRLYSELSGGPAPTPNPQLMMMGVGS